MKEKGEVVSCDKRIERDGSIRDWLENRSDLSRDHAGLGSCQYENVCIHHWIGYGCGIKLSRCKFFY